MKEYQRKQGERERNSNLTGILLTVGVHVAAFALVWSNGLEYLDPPPKTPETYFFDFTEETVVLKKERGREPQGQDVDREKDVNLVQRAESPVAVPVAENLTPSTPPDDFGDVETPAPEPEEPAVDVRATFPGMAKRDTTLTAQHSAEQASATYKAGQPKGNVQGGATEGRPNAHLEGRSVKKGGLGTPKYKGQKKGCVVIDIWVDQYGIVRDAKGPAEGSTSNETELVSAARAAALETVFEVSSDAPVKQHGTITYIFNQQ